MEPVIAWRDRAVAPLRLVAEDHAGIAYPAAAEQAGKRRTESPECRQGRHGSAEHRFQDRCAESGNAPALQVGSIDGGRNGLCRLPMAGFRHPEGGEQPLRHPLWELPPLALGGATPPWPWGGIRQGPQ